MHYCSSCCSWFILVTVSLSCRLPLAIRIGSSFIVRSSIDNSSLQFSLLFVHSCTPVRPSSSCTSLRIATTLQLPSNLNVSSHVSNCVLARGASGRRQGQADTDDAPTGLKAFNKALILNILLPAIEFQVVSRLLNAERFPMTGPNATVDEELVEVEAQAPPRVTHESQATPKHVIKKCVCSFQPLAELLFK